MAGGGHAFTEAIMSTFGLQEPKAEKNKVTKGDLTPRSKARYADATAEKLANTMQGPAGQLVSMIQSSVMICRAQTKIPDLNVDRLVLTGGTARMKGIVEYFQASMSVPVELFDPVRALDTTALPAEDLEEIGDNGADFAAAVGLAQTLLLPTAYKLEVLTESEKKKRQILERTIWAVGGAVAALVLVVLLFKTRADSIEEFRAANTKLEAIQSENKDTLSRKAEAEASELDARQKDMALRVRRLPGAATRMVLDTLQDNHTSQYIYLDKVTLNCTRRTFDLNGKPGEEQATIGLSEEARKNIHAQELWPEIEVEGQMVEDTPNPGGELAEYTNGVLRALSKLGVEGMLVEKEGGGLESVPWGIEMTSTSLDRNKRFTMRFQLVPPKPKE
jgi:cell division ATPase FtsA